MNIRKIIGIILLTLGILSFLGEIFSISLIGFSISTVIRLIVFISFIIIGYYLVLKKKSI